MSRRFTVTCLSLMAMLAFGAGQAVAGQPREVQPPSNVHAYGARSSAHSARPRNPDMTFHGGQVMATSAVKAIFWGSSWGNSSFVGDKISGLDSLYSAVGGSPYAGPTSEYSGSNRTVSGQVSYGGSLPDTSYPPSRAPTPPAIPSKVSKMITAP